MVPGCATFSAQGIEEQAGRDLREEVRRLRGHALAGRGDLADLRDRRRPQQERDVERAGRHELDGLPGVAGVAEVVEVRDVVVGEAERALEQQLLEDRGVQAGERALEAADRLGVAQGEANGRWKWLSR
jgi:hypothetical protein